MRVFYFKNMTKQRFLRMLFLVIGGKFYMDYILILNANSKVKTWRDFCKFLNVTYGIRNNKFRDRLILGIVLSIMSLFFLYMGLKDHPSITLMQILANIYPIIVQIYVGLRCHWILKARSI